MRMPCHLMKRHIRRWATKVVSYLHTIGQDIPSQLQDIDALLDHVDCNLEYEENLNYIFKELLGLPDHVLRGAGLPIETLEPEYGGLVDYDPTYVAGLKESVRVEYANRFLDIASEELGDFAQEVANAIVAQEIAPRGAFELYYWYDGLLPKKFEEADYNWRELVRLFIREVDEYMARKTKWERIVKEYEAQLSEDEKEILLDPTVPDEIKDAIIQQKGLAKPKPTPPTPPPRVEKEVAPPPKPKAPVRPLEMALREALERMGYRVRKILQYYRIGKNVYGVMFIDASGRTQYHYRVVVE